MNWYFLFFLSLFTGPAILCLFGNKLPRFFAYAIVCIIGLTTLPTSVDFIVKHIESDGSTIPANRLEMVSFLAGYGEYDETVIEVPYLSGYDSQQLDNWFWHDSSVIIAALGKKRLYVAHEVVPYPYDERIARYPLYTTIGKVIACRKREEACGGHVEVMVKELREHDIALLYVHKPTLLPESNTLKILKENETATLYEVLSM